jgi:hypothetical protein
MQSYLNRLTEDPRVQLQVHEEADRRLFHCIHVDQDAEDRRLNAQYAIVKLQLREGGPFAIATVCDGCVGRLDDTRPN